MFQRRTLFIVGAGASAEVGIPVGSTLAEGISKMLVPPPDESPDPHGEFILESLNNKHPQLMGTYEHAARDIAKGVRLTNSIDDYLDRLSAEVAIQRVGRAAIVRAIIEAEQCSKFGYDFTDTTKHDIDIDSIENTWFVKFFRMLGADVRAPDVSETIFRNVDFIIFNYDRCFEFFMSQALRLVYRLPESHAHQLVEAHPAIHPNGIVSPLYPTGGASSVPFGGAGDFDHDYVALSNNVKLFTEQSTDQKTLAAIHHKMHSAEQIVFLGFGFHTTNLSLLRPPERMMPKPILGTMVGKSPNSIETVQHQLANMMDGSVIANLKYIELSNMNCANLFDYHERVLPS